VGAHYFEHHPPGVKWKALITPDDDRYPDLTRIAELGALVEHFKRIKDEQINECLNALAEHREDMADLRRFRALAKEAHDSRPWGPYTTATDLCMQLAALHKETL
jgi:hypothetical protein